MIAIFDVDGVLMSKDKKPIQENIIFVQRIQKFDVDIFFWTAKREKERRNLTKWIEINIGDLNYSLKMRPDDTKDISGAELKKIWIYEFVDKNKIILAIDDDPKIVDIYKTFGICAFHCKSEFYSKGE